jgi:hypothetical protein
MARLVAKAEKAVAAINPLFFKFKWTIQNLLPIKVFPANFETMLLTIVIKVRSPKNSAIEKLIKRIASDPKMA